MKFNKFLYKIFFMCTIALLSLSSFADSNEIKLQLKQMRDARSTGNRALEIQALEKLIRDYPQSQESFIARYSLATLYSLEKQYDESIKLYDFLIANAPDATYGKAAKSLRESTLTIKKATQSIKNYEIRRSNMAANAKPNQSRQTPSASNEYKFNQSKNSSTKSIHAASTNPLENKLYLTTNGQNALQLKNEIYLAQQQAGKGQITVQKYSNLYFNRWKPAVYALAKKHLNNLAQRPVKNESSNDLLSNLNQVSNTLNLAQSAATGFHDSRTRQYVEIEDDRNWNAISNQFSAKYNAYFDNFKQLHAKKIDSKLVISELNKVGWNPRLVELVVAQYYGVIRGDEVPKDVAIARDYAIKNRDDFWYELPDSSKPKQQASMALRKMKKVLSNAEKEKILVQSNYYSFFVYNAKHLLPPPIRKVFGETSAKERETARAKQLAVIRNDGSEQAWKLVLSKYRDGFADPKLMDDVYHGREIEFYGSNALVSFSSNMIGKPKNWFSSDGTYLRYHVEYFRQRCPEIENSYSATVKYFVASSKRVWCTNCEGFEGRGKQAIKDAILLYKILGCKKSKSYVHNAYHLLHENTYMLITR